MGCCCSNDAETQALLGANEDVKDVFPEIDPSNLNIDALEKIWNNYSRGDYLQNALTQKLLEHAIKTLIQRSNILKTNLKGLGKSEEVAEQMVDQIVTPLRKGLGILPSLATDLLRAMDKENNGQRVTRDIFIRTFRNEFEQILVQRLGLQQLSGGRS